MIINAIIQARMGSKRFPGKVMADLLGKPVIGHILDNLSACKEIDKIIVAIPTADAESTLGQYLAGRDATVVTGPEQDVAKRFLIALNAYPCDGFVRVCADSPLMPVIIVDACALLLRKGCEHGVAFANGGIPGTQVIGVMTELFREYYYNYMTAEEKEHVTLVFVRRVSCLVDEPGDIERIERLIREGKLPAWLTGSVPPSSDAD